MRLKMLTKKEPNKDSNGASEKRAESDAAIPALARLEQALAHEADARADLERALAGIGEEQVWHRLPRPAGLLAAPLLLSAPAAGGSPERPSGRAGAEFWSPQTTWWR